MALTWKDVDFKQKTISVDKTICSLLHNKKTIVWTDTPKTKDSVRIIPLANSIHILLKELKKNNPKSEFVLSNKNSQIKLRVYQQSFANLLKKLNLNHYGFHSLRHTFATRAIENGCDVKSLSEILGHASVKITLDRYVHSSLEQKNRLVNKVGRKLYLDI